MNKKREGILGKGSDKVYTLLLRLSAPLQSWGSESVYDNRETDDMPTKSGVIGMLAAALGRKRSDSLEDLVKLKFGVRIDQQGRRLKDFQITQMGEKLNANLSYRIYLSDAIFLVGLECEDIDFLKNLEEALRHPRFAVFLGRRSCPPTQLLVLGIRDNNLYQSLLEEEWLVPDWKRKAFFRYSDKRNLRIVADAMEGTAIKKDMPISYSPFRREYGYRYIREMPGKTVEKNPYFVSTDQDPMMELR